MPFLWRRANWRKIESCCSWLFSDCNQSGNPLRRIMLPVYRPRHLSGILTTKVQEFLKAVFRINPKSLLRILRKVISDSQSAKPVTIPIRARRNIKKLFQIQMAQSKVQSNRGFNQISNLQLFNPIKILILTETHSKTWMFSVHRGNL